MPRIPGDETSEIAKYVADNDLEGYARKLHDLQSMDLYYAVPMVYRVNGQDFFGNYTITATTDTVFPSFRSTMQIMLS